MADHQTDRPAGEAAIGHQADDNAALAAQRGDARCGIQHFRHAGAADRPLIADDDHVAILEMVRVAVKHLEKLLLAVEDLGPTGEDIVVQTALDTGKLQHGAEFRRQVAAKDPQAAGRLIGAGDAVDHIAVRCRRVEARKLFGQGLAGTGQHIAIQQAGIEKVLHEDLDTALGVDIHHREAAERTRIDNHRHDIT